MGLSLYMRTNKSLILQGICSRRIKKDDGLDEAGS